MGEDPRIRVEVLQAQVRARLDDLRPLRPGGEGYNAAAAAVIEATAQMIDFEELLPTLLDQPNRRISLLTVRWSAVVVGVVGLALGIAAVSGWLSRWWLTVVVALVLLAAGLARLPVHPPCERHPAMRPGPVVAAAGALIVAIAAAGRLGLWLAAVGLILLVGGFLHARRNAPGTPSALVLPPWRVMDQ